MIAQGNSFSPTKYWGEKTKPRKRPQAKIKRNLTNKVSASTAVIFTSVLPLVRQKFSAGIYNIVCTTFWKCYACGDAVCFKNKVSKAICCISHTFIFTFCQRTSKSKDTNSPLKSKTNRMPYCNSNRNRSCGWRCNSIAYLQNIFLIQK